MLQRTIIIKRIRGYKNKGTLKIYRRNNSSIKNSQITIIIITAPIITNFTTITSKTTAIPT